MCKSLIQTCAHWKLSLVLLSSSSAFCFCIQIHVSVSFLSSFTSCEFLPFCSLMLLYELLNHHCQFLLCFFFFLSLTLLVLYRASLPQHPLRPSSLLSLAVSWQLLSSFAFWLGVEISLRVPPVYHSLFLWLRSPSLSSGFACIFYFLNMCTFSFSCSSASLFPSLLVLYLVGLVESLLSALQEKGAKSVQT